MPIDNEPLSIDDIYTAAEDDDPTRIADNAALRQQFNNRFAFDPEVSLWDENELKKKQKIEALRKAAQRNKETVNPFLEAQTEENKKIVMDDLDNLGSIGAGIGALNFKGASREELEDKILSIAPKISPKNAAVAKKYQEQKTRKPKVYAPDATQLLVNMTREMPSLNQKPKDEQRIEPVQEQSGNRYTRGVKRGAANVLQTVALLHDAGYLGFERGMEAIGGKNIGQPINSGLEPTQNKLFRAMEQLKQEKYGASDSLNNLMIGAEMAGQQADANEASGTLAAVKYFLQNGTLGDAGEILSEVVPSLVVGGGAGAGARATVGIAAERALARQAGMLARRAGGTVDPKKLARFAAPAGGAVQGAVMTGVTDFAGSAGAEYSAQYNEGKNMGEAMDYALRRSLAQAGVSAIGGALIPFGYGGKLAVAGEQAVVQGVAGYASAEAGAAAVGEDLSYSEGALNVLMGAITALPEVVAVGAGESISRRRIMQEVENGLMETALAKHTDAVDDQNIKAGYFAGVIGNLFQRVKESKTAGRSDEVMRDFVNQTRSNNDAIDSVYVDVESFNQTLTKHNIPIEDLMEMSPEIARQWEKVEDIDGTIRIPLDELLSISYRIDNDPMLKDLVNILRSEPLAPNAREAEVSLLMDEKVIKEDIQKIQQQYDEIRAGQEELLSVEKQIKADLDALSTGFDKSIGFNQQAATLVSAMYESLANKVKVPVADLYKAMPVRIVSNEAEAAAVLGGMGADSFNQSNDPQVELRKIYGYRDSHLAPDADGGRTADNLADVYPDLNSRNFTKDYGDGFKYDAKAVKVIRDMQKNPDMDVTVYRTVPKDADGVGLNFGDWITLTREYADEHGQARFDGDYRVIEQKVKARDIYTDGNSIHEWGYSPVADPVYKARKELAKSLEDINKKLDQALYQSHVKISDVLGDKGELKNNPALAKNFLDSKQVEVFPVVESSNVSDEVAAILPEIKGLEFNSDIKNNPDLLDRAFNALFISDLNQIINNPNESDLSKSMASRKINRFSDASDDQKFNLIDNKLSSVKNMKDGVNEAASRSAAVDQAKAFGPEYDQYIDNFLRNLGLDYYNQTEGGQYRGQIQFRKDRKGAVIIMGKDANFSTFAHEMGHHFLELNMMFARRPDAPQQLKDDMDVVLNWAKQGSDWDSMTAAEKTEVHEKFAETFEAYMFTGKAPSNALRTVFARFRSFMAAVYKNMGRFLGINQRADLNPEITAVMDRMLATQEAIEQVQRQRSLEMMLTPEMATQIGIPFKEFDEMQQSHLEATEAAINELEQKTIKDLAWYRNLRNKHMKAFTGHAKRIRQNIRESVAKEVAEEPVYQAIAFLRQPVEKAPKVKRDPNVVDTARDNLLEAIAKMGGIDAAEIESTWGIDQPESYKVNVGRVKKVARKGGLSIETVAERLAEYGYIDKDENGKFDTRQLEDIFTDSLGGAEFHSLYADYDLVGFTDDYNMAYGQIEEFPDAAKLNLDWLKSKYGEDSEIYKAIPKGGKYGLTSVDGFDPEIIAERFGYQSADQMIREIVEAPAPKDVINQRANELIEAQHAELFDEDSVNQAIDEAVHNDIRAQMLSREMAAIAKLTGRHNELNNAAKAIAQDMAQKTQLKDLRPAVFSATELRLAKAYDKALKAGDTTEAVRIKRNQLINFHLTKEAYNAKNRIQKLADLSGKIFGSDERLSKARDFNYVTLARGVVSEFELTNRNSNYMDQLQMIREYDPIAFVELTDLIQGLPDRMNFNELEYKDFQVVDDTIRQIWHLSKESQKFTVEGRRMERADVIADLTKQLNTKDKKSRIYQGLGSGNKTIRDLGSRFIGFTARLRRAEQFMTWLDDGKSNGFFHKYIFNPIQDALAEYRIAQREMKKEILDIYKQFDRHEGKIYAEQINHTFASKQELLHAILHSGNLSNKQRLVYGLKWGEELPDGTVDFSRWDAFMLQAMEDGTVTKKDMDAIQKIWNMFDGYKKQAQVVHRRMQGRYFEELPNQPLQTPYGLYEGGYIPADYDPIASAEADIRSEKSNLDVQKAELNSATTGANFTKSRVANFKGDALLLDLTRLPMHLDKELRYIHLEEKVKQVDSLLRNREFRRDLESVAPYVKNIMSDWLMAVATQQTFKPSGDNLGDRIVEGAKRNSGIVLMAGNFKNAIEAWTSLPQVMVAVPPSHLLVSSGQYFASSLAKEGMTAKVRALSPFMDTRLDNAVNDYRYQIENLAINPSALKRGSDFVKSNAYIVQQVLQVPLEVISWNAAHSDALAKGMNDADAIRHADGVVRQYLNDMTPEGLSSVERGSPLVRALLMFYGWFNMVGNTFVTEVKLASAQKTGLAKYGRYAYLYGMMMALPAILSKALTMAFNGDFAESDDEDDFEKDMTTLFVQSQAEMIFGMLPFARDVINPVYRMNVDASIYSDRYALSPIQGMVENLYKTGKKVSDTWDEDKEVDKSALVKGTLQSTAFLTGIPVTIAQRPIVYGVDVLVDEDQEPEDGLDVARGLLSGK